MTIKVVTGQQTFVKKIVVGTPISTAQTGLSIDNFSDFKVATKSEGQILVYDSAEQAFKNYDILVGNGLAKEFSPGTDKLLLQIDSDKTPIMTGLTTKGHIVPTADSTFDLGDSAKKFRDLYLSGGTIHLGNIDLKDSSGGFAATDSTGNPVNLNLQGSIPQIRRMFAGGGDLSYDTGTGVFQFDVEQVYTKANFDSDFNVTLDSAVLEGVGLNYSNASNTLNIDSAELESFFKPDIRGYFSASNTLNYNSTTGDFSLPQRLDSTDTPTFSKVTADSASIKELKIPDGGLGNDSARLTIGSDSDLKIFHDGSHSVIRDAGTGSLQLQTNNLSVQNATGTESQITALSGGAVSLFHNNSTKLATTAYGTTITGTVNADSATIPKVSGDSARFTRISGVYQGFDSDLARTTSTQTIRGYVSATDGGGDGSFSYNNSTGVFTYTGPSATEVRSHFSAQGDLSYDSTTGVFQFDVEDVYTKANFDSDFNIAIDSAVLEGVGLTYNNATNTLSIDSSELSANFRQDIRGYISATDAGGDGSFAYNATTGVFTYTGPSASEVRAHITGGSGIGDSVNGNGVVKIDSAELYSLYKHDDFSDFVADEHVAHTGVSIVAGKGLTGGGNIASSRTIDIDSANVRGMVSATDAGGDGSFSYNSGTGVFTYTGPSATEVKAHFQPLDSSANPTFNQVRGPAEFIIDPAAIGDATGTVKIMGNLQVEGTQTTINSSTIVLKDKNIVIADSAADSSALNGAGLTWGDSAIVSNPTFVYNHANARFVSNREINAPLFSGSGASLTALPAASLTGTIDSARIPALLIADIGNITAIDHDALTNFVANEHIDHTAVSITAGNGLTGGGTIASTRNLAIDSSQLANLYSKVIVHDNTNGFVANEHIDHTTVSVIAGKGLSGGGTIASNRTIDIDSANVRGMFSGGSGIGDSVNGNGIIKIDSAELYSLYKHDDFADFVADEHVAHTGVSIVAGKGLSGGGNIASSRTIDIDSANIRGMFSAGGDLSYNSGTGQFSFDVEAVYTKENFDSDYFLAKDSANAAVERNAHNATTKTFAVTVASKSGSHVYQGQGSGNAYYIDGTESPIVNLKLGRTYRFNLSSSDMSSHPFRFYYDAARTTQYTTNVSTAATYTEITITEATPPVLHYQCSSHGYMGHAVQISTRNFTGFTTTNLTEGSNLYYTDGRFDTRFASKSTSNLTEGSNLYYTDARARAVSLDSSETIALIDSAYVQARQTPATDSAATISLMNAAGIQIPDGAGGVDSARITVGNDSDLKIFHDGSNSVIKDAGTGALELRGHLIRIKNAAGTKTGLQYNQGQAIQLFYNTSKKFETTDSGVAITGQLTADSATFTNINLPDNGRIILGDSGANDFFIKYSGTQSQIAGTKVRALTSDFRVKNPANNETYITALQNVKVELYYDNVKKLETTDSGVTVTGEITADSATFTNSLRVGNIQFPTALGGAGTILKVQGGQLAFGAGATGNLDSAGAVQVINANGIALPDNIKATFGNDSDLAIFHNGSRSRIQHKGTGALRFTANAYQFYNTNEAELIATMNQNGAVVLYHDNSKKFETLDSGINITGNLRVNNALFTSTDSAVVTGIVDSAYVQARSATGVSGSINNVKADRRVGDASNKTFALSVQPADSDDVMVFVNGVLQHTNTYSLSGQNVILDSAPDSASEIEFRTHSLKSTTLSLRDYKSYIYTLGSTLDSVSGADSGGTALAYDPGFVDVYANGAKLVSGKDYTANTGNKIVFDSAFSSGNIIEVVSHSKVKRLDDGIFSVDSSYTTTSANQLLHIFPTTLSRSVKYVATLSHASSGSYHSEEILLVHNGTTVAMTTYAQVLLDSNLGTFDADINSGNVRLKITPAKTNTAVKLRAIRTPV